MTDPVPHGFNIASGTQAGFVQVAESNFDIAISAASQAARRNAGQTSRTAGQ